MRFRKTEDREHLLICRAISLPRFGEAYLVYRLFDNAQGVHRAALRHVCLANSPLYLYYERNTVHQRRRKIVGRSKGPLRRIIGYIDRHTATGFRTTLEFGTF
jgi:hypothetical protein